MIIAIDGPAGAGKSTVSALVGHRLGLDLVDTGAMYRALGLHALRSHLRDDQIENQLATIEIGFTDDGDRRVLLNGEEVSSEIRSLEVSSRASELSTIPAVRRKMVALQQAIIARGNWILEGRDVTTVVAPNADLKIFLTASIEERARRRWVEMKTRGDLATLQDVVKEVVQRDHRDYTRADSPLMLAEDAVILETYGVTPESVADHICQLAQEKGT